MAPLPDFDGAYPAGTVVNVWVYNSNPREGAAVGGADKIDPKGIASVIMNADRSIEVYFY